MLRRRTGPVYLHTLNLLAGGNRVHKYWTDPPEKGGMGFSFFPGMMKGTWNGVNSFVGIEVENEIRAEPDSKLARFYFQFCRRVVKRYCAPLRDMFMQYCQTLDVRQSVDEFKKHYPVLKGAGWMRNLLYIDFIEWVNCFEEIFLAWDAGNYDVLFPQEVCYPLQITSLMTYQLTALREKETELGTGQHKVLSNNAEEDRIKKMVTTSKSPESKVDANDRKNRASPNASNSKTKYVAAAGAVSTVGAAALSTIVSET